MSLSVDHVSPEVSPSLNLHNTMSKKEYAVAALALCALAISAASFVFAPSIISGVPVVLSISLIGLFLHCIPINGSALESIERYLTEIKQKNETQISNLEAEVNQLRELTGASKQEKGKELRRRVKLFCSIELRNYANRLSALESLCPESIMTQFYVVHRDYINKLIQAQEDLQDYPITPVVETYSYVEYSSEA